MIQRRRKSFVVGDKSSVGEDQCLIAIRLAVFDDVGERCMISGFVYGHIREVGIEVGSWKRLIVANGEQELLVFDVVVMTPEDTRTTVESNVFARQRE